jgi:enoyl-[acyl-carrier-protein] reductase (NADH)
LYLALSQSILKSINSSRMGQRVPKEAKERVLNMALLKRGASVKDIASQALLLCCSESMTGQTIVVDGGAILH